MLFTKGNLTRHSLHTASLCYSNQMKDIHRPFSFRSRAIQDEDIIQCAGRLLSICDPSLPLLSELGFCITVNAIFKSK